MLFLGITASGFYAKLVKVPKNILIAIIAILCVIGSYAIANSMAHVTIMFIMGIVGYLLRKAGFSTIPIVLGLILGPIIESNFQRTLIASGGSMLVFITRPLSLLFIVLTIVSISIPIINLFKSVRTPHL